MFLKGVYNGEAFQRLIIVKVYNFCLRKYIYIYILILNERIRSTGVFLKNINK